MRIERSIAIAAPLEVVFAFVVDPFNDPLWCPKVQSVESLAGRGPAGPGARYRVVHRPIPLRPARTMNHTLVAWDPPHRIDWHEDDGHDLLDVTYTLVAGGADQTRLTQTDVVLRSATPRLLRPVIRAGIGHDVTGQLKRLRRHLEGADPARDALGKRRPRRRSRSNSSPPAVAHESR